VVQAKVVLYELNEVPWSVLDYYTATRPQSNLAAVVKDGRCLTTLNEDVEELSPWRTWPTIHNSLYTREHNSFELGQDPSTFQGQPVWDVAVENGLRVGVFGALQSWPPRTMPAGFFIPDTFAKTPETFPSHVAKFQRFNLHMTADNAFSSDGAVSSKEVLGVATYLLAHGLRPSSAAGLVRHLLREACDARWKAARPVMQAQPSFDLFWRLHKSRNPHLSIYFTNHVASMMHRFWGDAIQGYGDHFDYDVDEVYSKFLLLALDIADGQLGRLLKQARNKPERVVVIAASMGQDAISPEGGAGTQRMLHLAHPELLAIGMGFPGAVGRLAMHPKCSIEFLEDGHAAEAAGILHSATIEGFGRVFEGIEVHGRSLVFSTSYRGFPESQSGPELSMVVKGRQKCSELSAAGVQVRGRLGGSNTAYHIPEGILLVYGSRVAAGGNREQIGALDVAPSILQHLGVPVPTSMHGATDERMFAARH